jgi:DNA-binding MarR family transcriptional regulator
VPQALGRVRVALVDAFERASREHGLTPAQAELLCAAMAPAPIGRLAQTLRCDRTNVPHLIARVAERGWVERQPAADDRRSALIVLTSAGEEVARRFIATLEEQLADLLAGWSAARRQQAAAVLDEIAEALDRGARVRPAPP